MLCAPPRQCTNFAKKNKVFTRTNFSAHTHTTENYRKQWLQLFKISLIKFLKIKNHQDFNSGLKSLTQVSSIATIRCKNARHS